MSQFFQFCGVLTPFCVLLFIFVHIARYRHDVYAFMNDIKLFLKKYLDDPYRGEPSIYERKIAAVILAVIAAIIGMSGVAHYLHYAIEEFIPDEEINIMKFIAMTGFFLLYCTFARYFYIGARKIYDRM